MTTEEEKAIAKALKVSAQPTELIMNADDAVALGWKEVPCAFPDCPIHNERHCHIRKPR